MKRLATYDEMQQITAGFLQNHSTETLNVNRRTSVNTIRSYIRKHAGLNQLWLSAVVSVMLERGLTLENRRHLIYANITIKKSVKRKINCLSLKK
jgi:hypothetical protein